MKTLLLPVCGLMLVAAACNPGESHSTEKTVTDTAVTPVHATDTTVVQKKEKVDVTTDTLKKTHKKP
ncbi:MAG TPA: hypothetical protein VFA43_24830 [Gemmatimonadaceae bacterium]|nr:hypothetical protein [Gemmatimonadaceae bacterium]